MATPPAYSYTIARIPSPASHAARPATLPSLAKRYAALRLGILLSHPTSFASNHAIEETFTEAQWEARVWREEVTVFVCIAKPLAMGADIPPASNESESEFDGEWVGAATFIGPIPRQRYQFAVESGSPESGTDAEETKWHMTAVFTSPHHRGQGLAKRLIDAVKVYARAHNNALPTKADAVRIRITGNPTNLTVIALYGGQGFVDVARATGREAFMANGDDALIGLKMQTEQGRQMMQGRGVLVMEYVESLIS
ncbi:hypothetical protein FIBSPDRAFT_819939 [Athelia psychrophila]|uniref:N-acetyltransferase domain-containing protein n=1 Tax=Athelia psychrophila TaxID=1759441 RepID=A0A166PL50_9AGAM|nr:hypothetical protein FIBSPDRAFT_819939 [Fibularhizoctonia sp. CBS 109695]